MFDSRLQFTLKVEDDSLHFLDVTTIKREKFLSFDWYHKQSFSSRYLNYYSNHPIFQKRDTIINLVDKTILLSEEYYTKGLALIINILIENDYPQKFIFDTINKRI